MALDQGTQVRPSQRNVQHRVHRILTMEDEAIGMVPLQHQLGCQQIDLCKRNVIDWSV